MDLNTGSFSNELQAKNGLKTTSNSQSKDEIKDKPTPKGEEEGGRQKDFHDCWEAPGICIYFESSLQY